MLTSQTRTQVLHFITIWAYQTTTSVNNSFLHENIYSSRLKTWGKKRKKKRGICWQSCKITGIQGLHGITSVTLIHACKMAINYNSLEPQQHNKRTRLIVKSLAPQGKTNVSMSIKSLMFTASVSGLNYNVRFIGPHRSAQVY